MLFNLIFSSVSSSLLMNLFDNKCSPSKSFKHEKNVYSVINLCPTSSSFLLSVISYTMHQRSPFIAALHFLVLLPPFFLIDITSSIYNFSNKLKLGPLLYGLSAYDFLKLLSLEMSFIMSMNYLSL